MSLLRGSAIFLRIANLHAVTICHRQHSGRGKMVAGGCVVTIDGYFFSDFQRSVLHTLLCQILGTRRLQLPLLCLSALIFHIHVNISVRLCPFDFGDRTIQRNRLVFIEF